LKKEDNEDKYGKYFDNIRRLLQEMNIDTYRYHIDYNHWMKFNELRDDGKTIPEISKMTEIHDTTALFTLEHARICIIKYNGDVQKVRACLEGKDKLQVP
jgi:hypothetical protein